MFLRLSLSGLDVLLSAARHVIVKISRVKSRLRMRCFGLSLRGNRSPCRRLQRAVKMLVALHLARQLKPDIPVMLVNTSIEFPESLAYVRELAEKWNLNYYEVKAHVNFWNLAEEQGIPVAGRGNTAMEGSYARSRCRNNYVCAAA